MVSQPRTAHYLGLRLSSIPYGADNLCFKDIVDNKPGYNSSSTPREINMLRGSSAGPGSPSVPLWDLRDPACDWRNVLTPTIAMAAHKLLGLTRYAQLGLEP